MYYHFLITVFFCALDFPDPVSSKSTLFWDYTILAQKWLNPTDGRVGDSLSPNGDGWLILHRRRLTRPRHKDTHIRIFLLSLTSFDIFSKLCHASNSQTIDIPDLESLFLAPIITFANHPHHERLQDVLVRVHCVAWTDLGWEHDHLIWHSNHFQRLLCCQMSAVMKNQSVFFPSIAISDVKEVHLSLSTLLWFHQDIVTQYLKTIH